MKIKSFFGISFLLLLIACSPSPPVDLEYEIARIEAIENESVRYTELDELWDQLIEDDQIPFKKDETTIFLYRDATAGSVAWNGDFNSWSGNKSFKNSGRKVPGTDLWMLKTSFPADARLDYKITVDDNWILDPVNPHTQWSGFGPNSELIMPKWKPEPLLNQIPEAAKGILSDYVSMESSNLNYNVQFQVYTPFDYQNLDELPVLYVLDGQEYSDDSLGAGVIVLDNLIHLDMIESVIAVFVDPRNPENSDENRRADEFGTNEAYAEFFTKELIPYIESEYKASSSRNNRALLGTSLGGLNTTYLGFRHPEIFGKLAIQAPAYWYREQAIYPLVRNSKETDFDIFMSVGTIGDNTNDARRMKTEFEKLGLEFTYLEVNEGHSWGAWSAQMDDILIQFFKK